METQKGETYSAPELVELGSAEELTLGTFGFNFDCGCDRRFTEPEETLEA